MNENPKSHKDVPSSEPEDTMVKTEEEEIAPEAEILGTLETDFEALYTQAQDRYQRNLAEFDNFRKRTTKEMAASYESGIRAAAEKLLPIADNFQRAMSANDNEDNHFYQGIALIARQFENVLSDMGIEPIGEGVGSVFDHNIHFAVAHVEDEAHGQNVVTEVLQRGYMHRDKVLRPSMVKVAN